MKFDPCDYCEGDLPCSMCDVANCNIIKACKCCEHYKGNKLQLSKTGKNIEKSNERKRKSRPWRFE